MPSCLTPARASSSTTPPCGRRGIRVKTTVPWFKFQHREFFGKHTLRPSCSLRLLPPQNSKPPHSPKIFRKEFSFLGNQKKPRNIHKQNAIILHHCGVCPHPFENIHPTSLTPPTGSDPRKLKAGSFPADIFQSNRYFGRTIFSVAASSEAPCRKRRARSDRIEA